jgi:hypothetical protein
MARASCIVSVVLFALACPFAQSLASARGAGGRASYCGGTHTSARPPAPRTERFHRGVLGFKLPPRRASFLSPCSPWHVHSRSLWRQREGQVGGPHTAGVRTNRPAHLSLWRQDVGHGAGPHTAGTHKSARPHAPHPAQVAGSSAVIKMPERLQASVGQARPAICAYPRSMSRPGLAHTRLSDASQTPPRSRPGVSSVNA